MKAPSEAGRLAKHRAQALSYWEEAADPARGVEAPRFVVLCAFRRLEIWEPGHFPGQPRAAFDLAELPDRYESLLFLTGGEPVFLEGHAAVTVEAVKSVAELFAHLTDRFAADPEVLRDFLLQAVWCMFAEDFGQIPPTASPGSSTACSGPRRGRAPTTSASSSPCSARAVRVPPTGSTPGLLT